MATRPEDVEGAKCMLDALVRGQIVRDTLDGFAADMRRIMKPRATPTETKIGDAS